MSKYLIDGKLVGQLEGEELEKYKAWQDQIMYESAESIRKRLEIKK